MILGLITFYGGYQLIRGELTLGTLSAITVYLGQLSGMQRFFVQFFRDLSTGLISHERLETILDAKRLRVTEDKESGKLIFTKGKIEFKDITFGYRENRMILENLNFYIEGGSAIALAGPSGCGKSTIINLLLRLYNSNSGRILLDGQDIRNLQAKSLYAQIGVALQEPYLWNDSIESNILYGNLKATRREMDRVTEAACLCELISGLKDGYRTVIGENACKISEGQKQRIAIARALIKKPKILILDEALSSVDMFTEAQIIQNLKDFLKETTLVVVSHRISAIKEMDLVYFFVDPTRMLIGPHHQLLDNPIYQKYLASLPQEQLNISC
jgi:ABC-type multidrug transport system fused ATPase/permease subunit